MMKIKLIHLPVLLFITGLTSLAQPTDRASLVSLMDQYLYSLSKHDASSLPLSKEVKIVENTEIISTQKGLWQSATGGPTDFKIIAADPDAGQVGFMGVIEENHKPTIAAVRLKVLNGQITEIDHLVVHSIDTMPLNPNMDKLRPAFTEAIKSEESVPREKMIEIANTYYEAIVNDNGDLAPFADDCQRRENGGISANDQTQTPEEAALDDFSVFRKMPCGKQLSTGVMSYITDINRRRFIAADEKLGLVFAFSIFVHKGEPKIMEIKDVPGVTQRVNKYGPFDLPAAHVFKIRNGQIHEIEAIGYIARHGIKNGWE